MREKKWILEEKMETASAGLVKHDGNVLKSNMVKIITRAECASSISQ